MLDPRFSLSPWERENVIRLKEACEERGIPYKSIFELAKYVLVTKSVAKDSDKNADDTRLGAALSRLERRRALEQELDLDSIDPIDAMEQVEEHAPGFFLSLYKQDKEGRHVVAQAYDLAPTEFILESDANCAKFLAAELCRMELAAADMEEARLGTAVVTVSLRSMTLPKAMRYLRFVARLKDYMSDMHSSRIRKIYAQVPFILSHLIKPAKKLLPKKIANRIKVVSRVSDLDKYLYTEAKEFSLREWMMERREVYNETAGKLKL